MTAWHIRGAFYDSLANLRGILRRRCGCLAGCGSAVVTGGLWQWAVAGRGRLGVTGEPNLN